MYSAYQITPECQNQILRLIEPRYERVYADHITVQFGGQPPLPVPTKAIKAVGLADDGQGIQALLIEIDGRVVRPDQSFYHMTVSLNPDKVPDKVFGAEKYKPVLSNTLLQTMLDSTGKVKSDMPAGWQFTRFDTPILLEALPVLRYTSQELHKKSANTR